ncbi:MAG TPA: adenylate/guanylate cyclase domain-containing protein [Spirochaetota bacterium]|nr:adenylate/guanylate cyclase domain-containing protein [Spirochaetota bacterium]
MNEHGTTPRRLFFDQFSSEFLTDDFPPEAPGEKITELQRKEVEFILCVLSREGDLESFVDFQALYREQGFDVESIFINDYTPYIYPDLVPVLENLNSHLKSRSCLVLSFRDTEFAGVTGAALLIKKGKSPDDAVAAVNRNKNININTNDAVSFLHCFKKYLDPSYSLPEDVNDIVSPRIGSPLDLKDEKEPEKGKGKKKKKGITGRGDIGLPDLRAREEAEAAELPVSLEELEAVPEPEQSTPEPADTGVPDHEADDDHENGIAEMGQLLEREEPAQDQTAAPQEDDADLNMLPDTSPLTEQESRSLLQFLRNVKPTIRFKLISIISLIIILSMGIMIFLATFFFLRDNKVRVQENNLTLSGVIALKVKGDFMAIIEKSNLMAATMLQEFRSAEQKRLFTNLFFSNDKDFIFVGIADRNGGSISFRRSIANSAFLQERQLTSESIRDISRTHGKDLSRAFSGEAVVHNVSRDFRIPVMAVSVPYERDNNRNVRSILVTYLKLDRVISSFSFSGITEAFMVNDRGVIIAHPDNTMVMAHRNLMNLPIVKMMMTSRINNGQSRYTDENDVAFLGSFKKIGFAGTGVIATVREELAFQEVFNIQKRNIFIVIIVLNISILIVYFFGKSLTTPILRLFGATKKIEEGHFNVDIVPTTRDEIGDLTRSFIAMGKGLEEREKMKDAFGKFVNKEIAEMVLRDEIRLGGERKMAAVFFSDIRSFTAISEKLEPEEVVEFLNHYMTRMVNCVNKTHGVVDKFIGDAIMALWGTPVSRGNDVENALNGALMMRRELLDFNSDRGGDRKPVIKIGCGINYGPVLAGQIGSEDRMEYTVIGDTVNLASRIEALNKPFGTDILITEDSYQTIKDIFLVEPMEKIKVKGKEAPQQIYCVLRRKDDPSGPSTVAELKKLIGTEDVSYESGQSDLDEEEKKYEIIES